jgi:hypothetical protein
MQKHHIYHSQNLVIKKLGGVIENLNIEENWPSSQNFEI